MHWQILSDASSFGTFKAPGGVGPGKFETKIFSRGLNKSMQSPRRGRNGSTLLQKEWKMPIVLIYSAIGFPRDQFPPHHFLFKEAFF